jgi:clumping factor A
MIVASLLLILVAVALLVVGLAAGSSALLISSIGASLLAAIALVIGARQAAAVRRASTVGPVTTPGVPPIDVDDFGGPRQADPDAVFNDPPPSDEGLASPGPMRVRVAKRDDAESALAADAAYWDREAQDDREAQEGPAPDDAAPEPPSGGSDDVSATAAPAGPDYIPPTAPPGGYDDAILTDDEAYERERAARAETDGDYDQASSYVGAAGSENPGGNVWRREHSSEIDDDLLSPVSPAAGPAVGSADSSGLAEEFGPGLAEEFGEPDDDDPDDEPLPQAVRPADAVRVARMDAEVLVVDGRPRYHVADCAHLVGKLTEPLPVAEAVELGFSPCGLCRPVDRLVAQAAHR